MAMLLMTLLLMIVNHEFRPKGWIGELQQQVQAHATRHVNAIKKAAGMDLNRGVSDNYIATPKLGFRFKRCHLHDPEAVVIRGHGTVARPAADHPIFGNVPIR